MASAPSVGAGTARMELEKDRGSPRGNRGSREPMDKDETRAGEEGLRGKIAEGPASRLSKEQLGQLPELLDQGAEAHRFH